MPVNFKHRVDSVESLDALNIGILSKSGNLTNEEVVRLERIREAWNFYEGYHWEGIDDEDSPQVTFNYCRPFVNKYVSFELGDGFTIQTSRKLSKVANEGGSSEDLNKDGIVDEEDAILNIKKAVYDFLENVWKYNDRVSFIEEMGQTKSITGEAWVKIQYVAPEDLDDPFEE